MKSHTAFITGSTGLLGNNLVRLLADKGYRIRALARDANKAARQFGDLDIEVVNGNMNDIAGFAASLRGVDILFHTAAHFRQSYSGGNHWDELYKTNVLGTAALLEQAYAMGIRNMVHVSSIAVLGGDSDRLVDESMLADPGKVDDYYRSKIETDKVIHAFLATHPDMSVVLVLPGWMHGPGDIGPTSAGRFVLDYLNGKLPGVIDARYSLVDARDVAQVMLAASTAGRRGERYLAAGRAMHMRELFCAMEYVSGKAAPKRKIPMAALWLIAAAQELYARLSGKPVLLSLATVRNIVSDYGRKFSDVKTKRELGVQFRPLEVTLRDEIDWYRNNRWI